MGKSSLMVRTTGKLREVGVAVAVLDLTAIGQNLTPEQWYDGLLSQVGQQLDLEDELDDYWLDKARLAPLRRFFTALREVVLPRLPGSLVLMVDEVDAVRSLPFSADEFFAGIRECYNRRTEDPEMNRLTFALFGVASPSDLIRDTRITPFNIGARIELRDFTTLEAAPLAEGFVSRKDAKTQREGGRKEETENSGEGQALLDRILYWTGGHPYLTQRVCRAAVETQAQTPDAIDPLVHELFFTTRSRESDDNLLFVRERLLRSEVDLAGLLTLYGQVRGGKRIADDKTNPLVSALHLSGIVKVAEGALEVRNRIYRQVFDRAWAEANMPEAEQRRQKAAYRRGLMRSAAVSAVIVAVLGVLVVLAINNARHAEAAAIRATVAEADARRRTAESDYNLYVSNMNLIQREWENNNISRVQELVEQTRAYGDQTFEWGFWNRLLRLDLVTLKGHTGPVTSFAFSPDGRRIVTVSDDTTAKVWDAQTGKEIFTLKGHTRFTWAVAFSRDGKRIVTGSADNTAKVWSADAERK